MGVIEGGDQGEGEDEWRREGGGKARQSMEVGLVGCAERALMVVGGAAVMMNVQMDGCANKWQPRSVNRSQN